MTESTHFATHFGLLRDEDLVGQWAKDLIPEARAALHHELQLRRLPIDRADGPITEGQPQAETTTSTRVFWWRLLKLYGALSPSVSLIALRDMGSLAAGGLWCLVFGLAGYLLAVGWLVKTQGSDPPWSRGATITSFIVIHAITMALMAALIRSLWSMGHAW